MSTYMRHVIMELEMVVDDGVVCMIELEEVFESSGSFVVVRLDIVGFDRLDVHC